ncbi:MAG: T9SS type A sorting domain-containing protein, partial [Bacteroidia bacterium]
CTIPYTVNVTSLNGNSPNATATAALCSGTATGTATSAPTGGTAPYTYSWNTTPVQSTATATNLLPGDYIVTVTDAEGCSSTQTVSVGNASAITLGSSTVTGNNSTSNPDGSATVVVEGGAGGFSYSWNTTPAQTTNSATNLLAGNYTVTVTDANNCTASFTVTVPSFTALKENAVTNSVSVFPNPTNGIISLKIENLQLNNAVVKVINLSGQTVYSNNLRNYANGTTIIDLSNQSNGVYFVQVVSDKEVITKRIIKAKN